MKEAEIVIAGAGLAGSIAATMLGRAGYHVVLVDPRPEYRPEFRCEKIDGRQMLVLEKTGLADAVRAVATLDGMSWVARKGRVLEKRKGDQWGAHYETMVNAVRAEIPDSVEFVCGKVADIETSDDMQRVKLADGEEITARLAIVANGLNFGLREAMGITREITSPNHSVTVGFDLEPAAGGAFSFPALTLYADRPEGRTSYITLFPIGATMRANLFLYREPDDPWLTEFRNAPTETLHANMPGLRGIIGDYQVTGKVAIRGIDLYVSRGVEKPGVVLVGDAYSTSCPAAGTGTLKVFTDVERLCNVHVPHWLSTPGMGADKIAAFYADPVKAECEAHCIAKAHALKEVSIGTGPVAAARRRIKFVGQTCRGALRQLRGPQPVQGAPEMPETGIKTAG